MPYRIGIDAGSKTIKIVVIGDNNEIVYSIYEKHRAAIKKTLIDVLHSLTWRYGDITGPVAVTGSAGLSVARELGIPFVQEVIATTYAVESVYPQADAVIELGGEDAKVMYLSGRREQRMNASCAGGTGGFIDTIAFMLGTTTEDMNRLAMQSTKRYPIASRCAVFAQSDVRPLINQNAKKSDIAASVLDAVVNQTLGGLACGRPITGTVVFLGGPLEHIPFLVGSFRSALELTRQTGIKPASAHLYTARGAALMAEKMNAPVMSLEVLERRIARCSDFNDDLNHLPPLFENESARMEFNRRHARQTMQRGSLMSYTGSAYLGIDAGSTTVKLALVDEQGNLLYSDYRPTQGDFLHIVSVMLGNMYRSLPKMYATKQPYVNIDYSCATGYGEDLLRSAFGIDMGIVETAAHLNAALHFDPDASFVLDIGGQDMKAIWVDKGRVYDVVLNEACSSGCGSFLEGTAYSLQTRPQPFNEAALHARKPVDLGMRCTVFMTSRVRHAQKIGVSLGDIAAGISYSVVKNALYRIIGHNKIATIGKHVIVQGGAFKADSVLRAFELESGVEVIRPDTAHLMGAIGAALEAKSRAQAQGITKSSLSSPEEWRMLQPVQKEVVCPGCSNSCKLTVSTFGDNRVSISGNRCAKAWKSLGIQRRDDELAAGTPNAVKAQQALIAAYSDVDAENTSRKPCIGLMNVLQCYEYIPFWHTLFTRLGFSIRVPADLSAADRSLGLQSVASESVCQAAKLANQRAFELMRKGASHLFMPVFQRGNSCAVCSEYANALRDSASIAGSGATMVTPVLHLSKVVNSATDKADKQAILEAVLSMLDDYDAQRVAAAFDGALKDAVAEQNAFEQRVMKLNEHALDWVDAEEGRMGVVIGGRPYHCDPDVLHGIDEVLQNLGVAVIWADGVVRGRKDGLDAAAGKQFNQADEWKREGRLLKIARFVADYSSLELVCLESFGCGYDAVNLEIVRDWLSEHSRPFTALKLDSIVDVAHVRIRLRTLIQSMESHFLAEKDFDYRKSRQNPACVLADDDSVSAPRENLYQGGLDKWAEYLSSNDVRNKDPKQQFVVPQIPLAINVESFLDSMTISTRSGQNPLILAAQKRNNQQKRGRQDEVYRHVLDSYSAIEPPTKTPLPPGISTFATSALNILDEPFGSLDWDLARQCAPVDLCATASFLLAHCVRMIHNNPTTESVTVPYVCKSCLVDSLPTLLTRYLGRSIDVEWSKEEIAGESVADILLPSEVMPLKSTDPLRVGLLGNPLMVGDSYVGGNLVSLLDSLGCQVVSPECTSLYVDDISYRSQMKELKDAQVDCVIYVQCFGCLKAHVQVSGQVHSLAREFLGLPLTVIDYDPEASALNRENRVRLAIEAAHRARPSAPRPTMQETNAFSWIGPLGIKVQEASSRLAMGESPQKEPYAALAYVLEEDDLSSLSFCNAEQVADAIAGVLDDIKGRQEEDCRRRAIMEKALEAFGAENSSDAEIKCDN